jgi:hypothetical protein
MNKTPCELYAEDPAAHEAHLRECADCQTLARELELLDRELASAPFEGELHVDIEHLPLAPWEGAKYRSWPLVLAGALTVLLLAVAGFLASGVPPLQGMRTLVPHSSELGVTFGFLEHVATFLQHLPMKAHIWIGVSFVVINAIFLLLLRRAPKGVDASVR